MNTIESDTTLHSTQTLPRTLLYFRFRQDVGDAIPQVEFALLQTNRSEPPRPADNRNGKDPAVQAADPGILRGESRLTRRRALVLGAAR
mgnify:CR=1 FL=1